MAMDQSQAVSIQGAAKAGLASDFNPSGHAVIEPAPTKPSSLSCATLSLERLTHGNITKNYSRPHHLLLFVLAKL